MNDPEHQGLDYEALARSTLILKLRERDRQLVEAREAVNAAYRRGYDAALGLERDPEASPGAHGKF